MSGDLIQLVSPTGSPILGTSDTILARADGREWLASQCSRAEGANGETLALLLGGSQANARLIAAAPDLLEVAKMAEKVATMELRRGNGYPDFSPDDMLDAARAAIAKVEGAP